MIEDDADFRRLVPESLADMREEASAFRAENLAEHGATRRTLREEALSLRVELSALKQHVAALVAADAVREERLAEFDRRLSRVERRLEIRDD